MPRTPLYSALRHIARKTAREQGPTIGRRAVLGGVGAAVAVAALPARAATPGARVAVVGAGLAGLSATWALKQAGVDATLFEGNTRLGGRCWTVRHEFAPQIAEHGGEFIDTGHHAIRALAAELGLHLDDVVAAQPEGTHALYWFDGVPYSVADAARDYEAVYPVVQRQNTSLGSNVSYRDPTEAAIALDAITVAQWIERYVPGGRASKFGRLVTDAVVEELAADTEQLSAINVIFLFAPDPRDKFDLYYTGSDQRFHVHGGNDQIVSLLAQKLDGQIETGIALDAVTRLPDGTVRLGFSRNSVTTERVFDRVILALPFSVMRRSVDYSRAGFRPLKQRAIEQLRMGHSVKFQLQFKRRVWNALGCDGEIRLQSPLFQTTWEPTRGQAGPDAVLNFWSGGSQADRSGKLDPALLAQRCLADAEVLLPGLRQAWTGRMTRDAWAYNPWSLGSYVYPPLGYLTQVMGVEPQPEGNCFFAGEHTYVQQTGYLNSGVASGQRAAKQLLASLT